MEGSEERSFERGEEEEEGSAGEGTGPGGGLGMVQEEGGEDERGEEDGDDDDKAHPSSAKRPRRTSQAGDGGRIGGQGGEVAGGAGRRMYRVFVPLSEKGEELDLDGLKERYPEGSLRIKLTDERIFNVLTNSHVRVRCHPLPLTSLPSSLLLLMRAALTEQCLPSLPRLDPDSIPKWATSRTSPSCSSLERRPTASPRSSSARSLGKTKR
jgi:hypothetical protein